MENLDDYKFLDFDDVIVKKEVYDYILNYCDEVEFLSEYKICFVDTLSEVYLPLYPELKNYLLDIREDVSWGMNGKIFKFKLDTYIKEILKDIGLTNFLYLDEDKKFLFQNTTLLKNNQIIYSVCTHESFDEFDEEFENTLATICKDKLTSSNIYKELLEKNKNKSKDELSKDIEILEDLCSYINRDINASIYQVPRNKEINYNNYIDTVNKSLSTNTLNNLINITSFKDFTSQDFIFTKEIDGKTYNNAVNPHKDITPLATQILNESKYLYAILQFEF